MAIIRPIQKAAASQVDDTAIQELLRDLGHALKNAQYAVAKSTLQLLLKHLPSLKSKNAAFLNAMTSLNEGLASRELTQKEFTKELHTEFVAYRLSVSKILDELKIPTQKEEMLSLEQLMEHERSSLSSFEETRDTLERQLLESSGVVVAYAPVIPMTAPPLDVSKLKANAFKADSFSGYPIVHKILVAGISTERILAEIEKNRGGDSKKLKGTEAPKPSSTEERKEVVDHFLDTVKRKFANLKLVAVGGTHQWYDATWFMLIPESHMKNLKRCTINSTPVETLIFKKWSFPFANRK